MVYKAMLELSYKRRPRRQYFLYRFVVQTELISNLLSSLGSTRKKRKPAADHATPDAVKTYSQTLAIPSLHGAKPPGISALDIGHGAASHLMVTGGFVAFPW